MQTTTGLWVAGKWLLIGAAILGGLYLLTRLMRQAEKSVRTSIDDFVVDEVARLMSEKVGDQIAEVRADLMSNSPGAGFREKYSRSIASVSLVFGRKESSYQTQVHISTTQGENIKARKDVTLDELPQKVQEDFLRGKNELRFDWKPAFMT